MITETETKDKMSQLPKIDDRLLEVMRHFLPIAKNISPRMTESQAEAHAIKLTEVWLDYEKQQAIERFLHPS